MANYCNLRKPTNYEISRDITKLDISPRVRIVRLVRPQNYAQMNIPNINQSLSYGFSIRGGLEYGTGFFISAIERDCEADQQGLKVGDQIIRINGYHVDDAVHKELVQFIINQERLVLKVRCVGILPVKERTIDPLTWHVVSIDSRKDIALLGDVPSGRDLKVILSLAPRAKLGCGICKGPEWKPGIFIQFTKEGGSAKEAGLRPGDQILSCNGKSFAEISFNEAVGIMKSSNTLELVIRPCAGMDLFPGESSGYNSSASSVNGDQSPCWGDKTSKRLSIVREESISHDRRLKDSTSVAKVDTFNRKPLLACSSTVKRKNNTTIIEFLENGTVINNSPHSDNHVGKLNDLTSPAKNSESCDLLLKQNETKTITVEVHRSGSSDSNSCSNGIQTPCSIANSNHIPPPPPLFADIIQPSPPMTSISTRTVRAQHSLVEAAVGSSDKCSNSLSSAISEELKRRAHKKNCTDDATPAAPLTELENRLKVKKLQQPLTISDERHNALMDEFKAVHKRMFKHGFENAKLRISTSKSQPTKYVKGTMGRVAATEMAKANGDIAELESIESFKLTNPQPTPVRPPSYYFCPQNSGPPTMTKSQKPIAVTISEYSNSVIVDEPKKSTRFAFTDTKVCPSEARKETWSNESRKAVSRSNLRQESESMENLTISEAGFVAPEAGSSLDTHLPNKNRITIAISNTTEHEE